MRYIRTSAQKLRECHNHNRTVVTLARIPRRKNVSSVSNPNHVGYNIFLRVLPGTAINPEVQTQVASVVRMGSQHRGCLAILGDTVRNALSNVSSFTNRNATVNYGLYAGRNSRNARILNYHEVFAYPNTKIIPSQNTFPVSRIKRFIKEYVYLPLSLLHPTEEMSEWVSGRLVTIQRDINRVELLLPPFVMHHPALVWFTHGLIRQALSAISAYHTTSNVQKASTSGTFLRRWLNESRNFTFDGSTAERLRMWRAVRPIIAAGSVDCTPYADVWFYPVVRYNLIEPQYSSINEFEALVLAGGWPAMGREGRVNWYLPEVPSGWNASTHGHYARTWESFLRVWSGDRFESNTNVAVENRPSETIVSLQPHRDHEIEERFYARARQLTDVYLPR